MKKPKNLKRAEIDRAGFACMGPYVYCDFTTKPLRITLDGVFGVQDLEWIIEKMKAQDEVGTSMVANSLENCGV